MKCSAKVFNCDYTCFLITDRMQKSWRRSYITPFICEAGDFNYKFPVEWIHKSTPNIRILVRSAAKHKYLCSRSLRRNINNASKSDSRQSDLVTVKHFHFYLQIQFASVTSRRRRQLLLTLKFNWTCVSEKRNCMKWCKPVLLTFSSSAQRPQLR